MNDIHTFPPKHTQRPHAAHYSSHVRGDVFPRLRRWIPDSFRERIGGWLWPRFREVIAAAIFFLAGFAFCWWALS